MLPPVLDARLDSRTICHIGRIVGAPSASFRIAKKVCARVSHSPRYQNRGADALLNAVGYNLKFEICNQASCLETSSLSCLRTASTAKMADEEKLEFIRQEVQRGRCFVQIRPSLTLQRVVFLEVAEIRRNDGRFLVEVGRFRMGKNTQLLCRLPGAKRTMYQDKYDSIRETINETFSFNEANAEVCWEGCKEEPICQPSTGYTQVDTLYIRSVHFAAVRLKSEAKVEVDGEVPESGLGSGAAVVAVDSVSTGKAKKDKKKKAKGGRASAIEAETSTGIGRFKTAQLRAQQYCKEDATLEAQVLTMKPRRGKEDAPAWPPDYDSMPWPSGPVYAVRQQDSPVHAMKLYCYMSAEEFEDMSAVSKDDPDVGKEWLNPFLVSLPTDATSLEPDETPIRTPSVRERSPPASAQGSSRTSKPRGQNAHFL